MADLDTMLELAPAERWAATQTANARAMTEATLQSLAVTAAQRMGWLAYHTHDSRRSQPGFPDLVLVHPVQKRVLYRELKTIVGRIRPEQATWLKALLDAGEDAAIWRPSGWFDGAIIQQLTAPAH